MLAQCVHELVFSTFCFCADYIEYIVNIYVVKLMLKPKCCQLSGAKMRNLAKEKVDKTRSTIASAPHLDRYIVHSKIKVTNTSEFESQSAATACKPSATITS